MKTSVKVEIWVTHHTTPEYYHTADVTLQVDQKKTPTQTLKAAEKEAAKRYADKYPGFMGPRFKAKPLQE